VAPWEIFLQVFGSIGRDTARYSDAMEERLQTISGEHAFPVSFWQKRVSCAKQHWQIVRKSASETGERERQVSRERTRGRERAYAREQDREEKDSKTEG